MCFRKLNSFGFGIFFTELYQGIKNIGIIKTGKETFFRLSKIIAAPDKSILALPQTLFSCNSGTCQWKSYHHIQLECKGEMTSWCFTCKKNIDKHMLGISPLVSLTIQVGQGLGTLEFPTSPLDL